MNTGEIMNLVANAKKYIISDKEPRFLDECPWLDIYFVQFLIKKSTIPQEQKEKFSKLTPLDLPVMTMTLNCPIQGNKIAFALHYYYIDDWIISSATMHYICTFDIFMPDSLKEAIMSL